MAKVQIHPEPTPVAAAVAAAHTPGRPVVKYHKDGAEHVLELAEPDVLASFRIVEALGETAENRVYMAMVFPLLYISKWDGEDVFAPNSKLRVEAMISRLGHKGLDALREGTRLHFSRSEDEQKAEIKN